MAEGDEQKNTRDIFISYAGEDLEEIARPLNEALNKLGVSTWFATTMLRDGDSLSKSIGQGLATAQTVILVLSESYLSKGWTKKELETAIALDAGRDQRRIKPLIVGDWLSILRAYPLLADTVHSTWDGDADNYATKIAQSLNRRPGIWHASTHPDDYIGDVWVRLTPKLDAPDQEFHVSILWGANVLEWDVPPSHGPVSLTHGKQFPGVVPLYVRVVPHAIVTTGQGAPPDQQSHDINAGWNPARDASSPPGAAEIQGLQRG